MKKETKKDLREELKAAKDAVDQLTALIDEQTNIKTMMEEDLTAAIKKGVKQEEIDAMQAEVEQQNKTINKANADLNEAVEKARKIEEAIEGKGENAENAKPKILESVVIKRNGKKISGEPERDNYAVYLKKDAKDTPGWEAVLAELKEHYPRCVFTFMGRA